MLGQYLITFREVLEAALVVSIVLAYMIKTDRLHLTKYIWWGVALAAAASIAAGAAVAVMYGSLTEATEKLFEGLAALIAVAVLTTMILWMALRGSRVEQDIKDRTRDVVETGTVMGLVAFAFIMVFREGFETVLFLTPFASSDPSGTVLGLVLGLVTALALAYAIFRLGVRIDLKRFFYLSSILLVLLAAGLAGYGVHELLEYGEAVGAQVGWVGEYAYQLDVPSDSPWYHKGTVGSVFAVMFGYSVKMEWARVFVHVAYLAIFLPLVVIAYKRPDLLEAAGARLRALPRVLTGTRNGRPDAGQGDR
ncbi:MAG: FTR1 family protein [Thermoplasmata archaeon]|nr:MAG: FTR1 family protein [Thermoplasmata archaeon]